jgi:hypothetical protein
MEDYENDINVRCWSHEYGIENKTEECEEDTTSAKSLIQKVLQLYGQNSTEFCLLVFEFYDAKVMHIKLSQI